MKDESRLHTRCFRPLDFPLEAGAVLGTQQADDDVAHPGISLRAAPTPASSFLILIFVAYMVIIDEQCQNNSYGDKMAKCFKIQEKY